MSGETQDGALAAFAGELLALAGPLDPSAIAFKPACAPQPKQAPATNQLPAIQDSVAGKGDASTALSTMMVAALQLMADYLIDADVVIIKSVQFTLRQLLGTQLARAALLQLDGVTQGYLQVHHS